jgi:hypothetical protein
MGWLDRVLPHLNGKAAVRGDWFGNAAKLEFKTFQSDRERKRERNNLGSVPRIVKAKRA